jgi:hypothetical protein
MLLQAFEEPEKSGAKQQSLNCPLNILFDIGTGQGDLIHEET